MRRLMIDIETYSSADIKNGVYKYAESPDFEILLFAYAYDDEPVQVIDLTDSILPGGIIADLSNPEVIKEAYNAQFERVCLSRYLGVAGYLPPEQWHCTMIHAATMGLPRSLADVGAVLGLPEDKQKMKEGKQLIQYFCVPCKPTKANCGRTRNYPTDDPLRWQTFKAYNKRDVETEAEIAFILSRYPVPDSEWEGYWLDQRINDRGVLIHHTMAANAVRMADEYTARLKEELQTITGLSNPNSVSQLKAWIGTEGSLDKKAIKSLRQNSTGAVDRALAIRQQLGKSSVSKYKAMLSCECQDHRVRGLFAYYGSRTGRWAGRAVQLQNLPHDSPEGIDVARQLVIDGGLEDLEAFYPNVPKTLSELIRTALIAPEGKTFCVADFSAIEARVVAWLAGEDWRQDLFRSGKGDIYCASASQMFHVPVVKHGINGHLRQKGKIAELALGYGGSVGALTTMGALDMGLKQDELKPLVDAWRESNPNIVSFWWAVDEAAQAAIVGQRRSISVKHTDADRAADNEDAIGVQSDTFSKRFRTGAEIKFSSTKCPGSDGRILHIQLPSGRKIRYWDARLQASKVNPDRDTIAFKGTDTAGWSTIDTYGPKLVENTVQAVARDCLLHAMSRVQERYPHILMHVHDEMIVEVDADQADDCFAYMLQVMREPIPWAPGLILKGDGYITPYYRKD